MTPLFSDQNHHISLNNPLRNEWPRSPSWQLENWPLTCVTPARKFPRLSRSIWKTCSREWR